MQGLKKASGGLIDPEVTGQIPGEHSTATLHSPASLLIVSDPGLTEDDYIIVHLHSKHENREFKTSVGRLHSNDQVVFRAKVLSSRAFLVDFSQGLGDYAVLNSRAYPHGTDDMRPAFLFTFEVVP